MTTVIEKLKLTQYQQPVILDLPVAGQPLFMALSYTTKWPKQPVDLIIKFAFSLAEIQQTIQRVADKQLLTPKNSYLFIAYPKKTSPNYPKQGIGRDDLFPYLQVNDATGEVGATGLKFSRMVALDADFTIVGLQPLLANQRQKTVSARVSDYQTQVPVLRQTLVEPTAQAWFDQLTPGYQRAWARFVYAVKTEQTKASHLAIFQQAMQAKMKTIEAWRRK